MAPERPGAPQPGDIRIVATATVSVFGFVLAFVLTMTFMGVSPWEAVGVAIAAGTVTGTITRLLHDLLPSRPRRADASAETEQGTILPEPTEDIS